MGATGRALIFAALAVACGGPPPSADAGQDAGLTAHDGGRDVGDRVDAGDRADAGRDSGPDSGSDSALPRELAFDVEPLAPEDGHAHALASVRAVSLTGAGSELLVAEPTRGALTLLTCADTCEPSPIVIEGEPVRASVADLDHDGRLDVLVADIGELYPTNERVGRVLLASRGDAGWSTSVLAEGLGRTTCVEPGDLDDDGDVDLVVCEFGHDDGGLFWLDRLEVGAFVSRSLHTRAGTVDAWPSDVDADGDLDVVSAVSQDHEVVLLHRNEGGGAFVEEVLFESPVPYFGTSGLVPADLDQDGDVDFVLTNGDTLDADLPLDIPPDEVHGARWLSNDGDGRFTVHPIVGLWGAYAAKVGDLDADGDLDVVIAAHQIPEHFPSAVVRDLVWMENDGSERFTMHVIEGAPSQLVALELVDVDADGDLDIVTGTMHQGGEDRGARLVLLRSRLF